MSRTFDERPSQGPLPWAIATLFTLSSCQLVSCPGGPCRRDPDSDPEVVSGHLVDAQGNNVPIATIVATQAGTFLDCSESGSDAGAGERSSDGNDAWFACEVFRPGAVTVEITALGHTMTAQINVIEHRAEGCDELSLFSEPVKLKLPGPGCPPASGTAIEGRLRDVDGNPTQGILGAYADGAYAQCTTSEGHFWCPVLSPYATHYLLKGRVATSTITRVVAVAARNCLPARTEFDIDLSTRDACTGEVRPAIETHFYARCMSQAPEPTGRVRVTDEEYVPCDIAFMNPWQERCVYTLTCPALTVTGGGSYTLEVSQGSKSATVVRKVDDDGCTAIPNHQLLPIPFSL